MKVTIIPDKFDPTPAQGVEVRVEKEDFIYLMPFADLHVGHVAFNEKLFLAYLNTVKKNKNIFVILNGDLIENAGKITHGTFDQNINTTEQIRQVVDYFKPIAKEGRLLGLTDGNHEFRANKNFNNLSPTQIMAEFLDVPFFGVSAFIGIMLRDTMRHKHQSYVGYMQHGGSGARTVGGKMTAVERLDRIARADFYIMSHLHHQMQGIEMVWEWDWLHHRIREKNTNYILTGSFMDYENTYAHYKAYPPPIKGAPKIKFHLGMRRVTASMGGNDVEHME